MNSKFITIIRPSFMAFCEDACRAAAFNHLLFRIAGKSKDQPKEKIVAGDILWYAKTEQITEEMANAWGVCKVRKEVNSLIGMGIIGRCANPEWGADRTKHFCFGNKECKRFLQFCEKHEICVVHLGLSPEVTHLIYISSANDTCIKCTCANDESIECIRSNHQMETIDISDANDKSIEAIPIDIPTKDDYKEEESSTPAFYSSQEIPVTYHQALAYLAPHGPHEGLDAVQVMKLAQKLWIEAHETPLVAGGQFKQVVKGAMNDHTTSVNHSNLIVNQHDAADQDSGHPGSSIGPHAQALEHTSSQARDGKHEHTDGPAAVQGSEPVASGNAPDNVAGAKDKPKRTRKKPTEVQLTLHEQEIKQWYEELRGVEVSFSKRNVAALQALGKRTMSKDDFLNVTAVLDGDKWFEERKVGVDLYWIDYHWDNKIIYLQRKKPALDDKKPVDVYTANSMDKEKMRRRMEERKADRLAREAAQQGGVN